MRNSYTLPVRKIKEVAQILEKASAILSALIQNSWIQKPRWRMTFIAMR